MKGTLMRNLIPFTYDDQPVRVATIDGEPWFVLADLCKVLDIKNVTQLRGRLDDALCLTYPIADSLGRTQQATIVSEAGMYEVVIRSDKPEAAQFRRWITAEVLPSVRKHGAYMTPETIERTLTDPDFIIGLAQQLKSEQAKVRELTAKTEADAPKVVFADAVAVSKTSILVGDLAKLLRGNGVQIGANRLFEVLRERGYLINRRGTDWNRPTQYSMELGLFEVKETAVTHSDGHTTINLTPKVTGKGQQYFITRFLDGRIETEVAA